MATELTMNASRRGHIRYFLNQYPGMTPYYIGDPQRRKPIRVQGTPDTKFCTLVVMLMLLMFTSLSVYLRRDLNEAFYTQLFVEDQFYTYFNPRLNQQFSGGGGNLTDQDE